MFTRKWQLTFLYIALMDLGARHLTIIVGTGDGAFANKNCPQAWVFDHFFKCLGFARGFAQEGGCSRPELTQTLSD